MDNPILFSDLRIQLAALHDEAESISASSYDTAMTLRFAPATSPWPAFAWLLDQQAGDGAWGDPTSDNRARTVPTLAAVLALTKRSDRQRTRDAIAAGLAWLRRTAYVWGPQLSDDLPVGIELLLESMLDDAEAAGLSLPVAPYAQLLELGRRRRARLAHIPSAQLARLTAAHSFEALRRDPHSAFLSSANGVGCSPAATAVWLHASTNIDDQAIARAYLERAAAATGLHIPGVVPTAFPISRFVQVYVLHTLAQTGLLRHPALADLVPALLDDTAVTLRTAGGVGCADGFPSDGDDTAAAMGALLADERPVDLSLLRQYDVGDHFASYVGELQPSVITTARAAQVLAAAGEDISVYRRWIADRQLLDGRWQADKWNGQWLYTAWQAILALRGDRTMAPQLHQTEEIILAYQHSDGGWGACASTPEVTAYALLALHALPFRSSRAEAAIVRGRQVVQATYRPFAVALERNWLAKDRYTPIRLARTIILAALAVTEPHP